MTQDPFSDVLAANDAYAADFALAGLPGRAARSLAVLTCMDTRLEPLAMLGLRPGEAKILRNPGARVTPEMFAALVISRALLGVDRIMVIAHTRCRMAGAGPDEVRAAVAEATGQDARDLTVIPAEHPDADLREDVARLLDSPHLSGVAVGGFRYDVDTGRIARVC